VSRKRLRSVQLGVAVGLELGDTIMDNVKRIRGCRKKFARLFGKLDVFGIRVAVFFGVLGRRHIVKIGIIGEGSVGNGREVVVVLVLVLPETSSDGIRLINFRYRLV